MSSDPHSEDTASWNGMDLAWSKRDCGVRGWSPLLGVVLTDVRFRVFCKGGSEKSSGVT